MGYGDFKNLAKGTAANKVLKDKADPKYDGYQRGLISKKKKLQVAILNLCHKMSN